MSKIRTARQRDLLVDPDGRRWVVEDKGITWVTDRYVIARADLFTSTPKPKTPPGAKPRDISKTDLRLILAGARGRARAFQPTDIKRKNGDHIFIAGTVAFGLNERVRAAMVGVGLHGLYVPERGLVAWFGYRRGKRVLCAAQMACALRALRFDDLERAS